MPTWLKIILAIFLTLLALVALGVFLGYRWFQQNKGKLRDDGQRTMEEGRAFGAGKTAAQCLDEAIVRLDRDRGFMGEVRTRVFFSACAQEATPSPELCVGAPKRTQFIKVAEWSMQECAKRGHPNSQPCTRLMGELIERCEKSEASK